MIIIKISGLKYNFQINILSPLDLSIETKVYLSSETMLNIQDVPRKCSHVKEFSTTWEHFLGTLCIWILIFGHTVCIVLNFSKDNKNR